jgi:acetyl-CoA acyltransferase
MRDDNEAVIVGALRTPIGKRGGALAQVRPDDLAAFLLQGLCRGVGIEPGWVDDVIMGCATPVGEQGWNIGRQAVLLAGFPVEVPAVTINRMCASSDQAVRYAAQAIRCGDADVVVAAGVESMSRVPMTSDGVSFSSKMPYRLIMQGLSAQLVAERFGISRAEMDEYALFSHRRAVAAQRAGAFDRELLPVSLTGEDGVVAKLEADEGPRPGTSLAAIATLPPAFQEDGSVTAGNSSQMSDGAAGLVLTSRRFAEDHGLRPRARVLASVSVGSDPVLQLAGVIDASRKALDRAGLPLEAVDHVEVNEAFASVALAWLRAFEQPVERVNPRGGAIALGHPLGATGARLLVTALHALEDSGGRVALTTMCIGHGMANATVLERLEG